MIAIIGTLLGKVFGTIDTYVTDKGEAAKMKAELKMAFVDVEKQLIEAQASIIVAEAQSESWIARTWRPMLMVGMMGSIFLSLFISMIGYPEMVTMAWYSIPETPWKVIMVGMGGYIGGRTIEKTARIIAPMIRRKK